MSRPSRCRSTRAVSSASGESRQHQKARVRRGTTAKAISTTRLSISVSVWLPSSVRPASESSRTRCPSPPERSGVVLRLAEDSCRGLPRFVILAEQFLFRNVLLDRQRLIAELDRVARNELTSSFSTCVVFLNVPKRLPKS